MDVTDEYTATAFNWTRNSGNESVDEDWNAAHSGMKSITVSASELTDDIQIQCTLTGTSPDYGSVNVNDSFIASHTRCVADSNDTLSLENGTLFVTTDDDNYRLSGNELKALYPRLNGSVTANAWVYHTQPLKTIEFKYNSAGLRVQKKVTANGKTEVTDYTLHGKLVTYMTVGNDKLHFFYDAQSRPAKVNFNGVTYTYLHNLQGDVVGILDNGGNLVVEYKCDAWGKLLSTTGSLADTLGVRNPFRYRGYIYDTELGLYYLRNRYYSYETCRFINHDRMIIKKEEWDRNGYVYGANSPINRIDPNGYAAENIFNLLVEKIKNAITEIKKTIERMRLRKSLSSSQTFSYVIDSYDRTYGLFGSFREISTTTLIVIPAGNIKDYIFEKWMSENYVNTAPIEEGFNYTLDILLEFLPDAFPGFGIAFGVPASITNLIQSGDDAKLAKCISKAIENNTGIVVINDSYVSSYDVFEKNTYYEFFDYLDSIG